MENMFTITPMTKTIELVAGRTYTGSIVVAKAAQSAGSFEYVVKATGFNVEGEADYVDLLADSERNQIVDWISIENPEGVLDANQKHTINYTITVPENAPAGGQYAAIVVSSKADEETENKFSVKNIYEIGSIIYARVDGEINHSGKVLENKFPSFVTSLPIVTESSYVNEGNIHEDANITVEVKDVITGQTVYPKDENGKLTTEMIMPGTTRNITRSVDDFSELGVYEVKQTVEYMGETNEEVHLTFACPIWFMVLALVVILALGGVIFLICRKNLKNRSRTVV